MVYQTQKLWLWLHRNILTEQVIITWLDFVKPIYLRQIKDVTLRPSSYRRDHWTPLAVVTGFKNKSTPMSLGNLMHHYMAKKFQTSTTPYNAQETTKS